MMTDQEFGDALETIRKHACSIVCGENTKPFLIEIIDDVWDVRRTLMSANERACMEWIVRLGERMVHMDLAMGCDV